MTSISSTAMTQQSGQAQNRPPPPPPPPGAETSGVGRSEEATGQQAKQAVGDARQSGADMPKNAQGIAASQIAQGADPASIFAALFDAISDADAADEADIAVDEAGEGTESDSVADILSDAVTDLGVVSDTDTSDAESGLALLSVVDDSGSEGSSSNDAADVTETAEDAAAATAALAAYTATSNVAGIENDAEAALDILLGTAA